MSKKTFLVALISLVAAGIALAADPVEGLWKSIDETTGKATAFWKIYQTGGKLQGEIVRIVGKPDTTIATDCKESYKNFPVAGKVNQMKVIGTPWIWGLTMKKAGEWAGGNIIDPGAGDMYQCKITFRAKDGKKFLVDTLEMRGEIGLGIGRSQFWQRATEAELK
jgi:uncharacterized protein (DUF2147 family)